MSWSISISGHEDSSVANGSVWYSSRKHPAGKTGTFSGVPEEVAEKAIAFIRQCQAEAAEAHASPSEVASEAEDTQPLAPVWVAGESDTPTE